MTRPPRSLPARCPQARATMLLAVLAALGLSTFALAATSESIQETVAAYTAAWNERDEAERRGLLEKAWADGGVYVDPTARVEGREALVAHIAGFHQQMPDATLALDSGVDVHHDTLLRFRWKLVDASGQTVTEGIDFGELAEDGRLVRIVGFFGPFPPLEP